MNKEPIVYLQHILESIDLIERRINNCTNEDFLNNIDLQDMVIRRLEIIGEAVRNLTKEFRKEHHDVNWQDPADMRSILIHGYLDVDLDIVWNTVKSDLPQFKEHIQKLLKELES